MVVQVLGLGLEPAWRRECDSRRCEDARAFCSAVEEASGVTSLTYSSIGLQPGVDLVLWRLGTEVAELEHSAGAALQAGLGRWLRVCESRIGLVQESPYVRLPQQSATALFHEWRSRYLVVYPFTKSAEWYLLDKETRQRVMNEHMKVGHSYPKVRQLLANSFGVDDMDFLVAYETDDLAEFGNLVRELRGTESRRSTVRDTPILTAVHRDFDDLTRLLGA